jgi:hypothetical protein
VGRRHEKTARFRAVSRVDGDSRLAAGLAYLLQGLLNERHFLMLDGRVLMILNTALVADDLPIEPINHEIDGRVQIAVGAFDEDVFALQMKTDFNLLPLILLFLIVDREDHIAIDHLIEMSQYLIELGDYVLPQCWRDVEMVSTDLQIHSALQTKGRLTPIGVAAPVGSGPLESSSRVIDERRVVSAGHRANSIAAGKRSIRATRRATKTCANSLLGS